MSKSAKSVACKIVCGLDVGNGYTKGKATIDGGAPVLIDLPSCVSYTVGAAVLPKEPTANYLSRLVNELDCDVMSRGIKPADEGRVLFGERAIHSGESQIEFNIDSHVPKCDESLSTMLVLGPLAAIAIEHATAKAKQLPEHVDAEVTLGVALPIIDYMEHHERYANTFKRETHRVIVHNFSHDVEVALRFPAVTVLPEGAAAQYAITSLGADFLQLALDQARAENLPVDPAYTGAMLAAARSTIGIDVGEGTVNFPVFQNGEVSIDNSSTINQGYGSVLSHVVADLRNTECAFSSRKDLADFMLVENVMPTQRYARDRAQHLIDSHVRVFCREVMKEYSNLFRRVGMRTDVVYVYGGGANPVRSTLYPLLVEASTLGDAGCLPIIYLDSSYSRDLNRNGLFEAARAVDATVAK